MLKTKLEMDGLASKSFCDFYIKRGLQSRTVGGTLADNEFVFNRGQEL